VESPEGKKYAGREIQLIRLRGYAMGFTVPRLALILATVSVSVALLAGPWANAQQKGVQLVTLPVVVSDLNGQLLTNLKPDDFRVFEDGVEQKIVSFKGTDDPISVILLLDASYSIKRGLLDLQNAAIEFINLLNPRDPVQILTFAGGPKKLHPFSTDRTQSANAIGQLRAEGPAFLYDSLRAVLRKVVKPIIGRKTFVIIAAGRDSPYQQQETLELAQRAWATIYGVYTKGSQMQKWESDSLRDLSESTGGSIYNGGTHLSYAVGQVAKELASQYSIGYYPTNSKHSWKVRKVEVKMAQPGLKARTRTGYYDFWR
jgi:Ca-activated chloride channel homolog